LLFIACIFIFFSFGHCIVCPSLIYGFWLPICQLQTFLSRYCCTIYNSHNL
jgi:hypothetical protein